MSIAEVSIPQGTIKRLADGGQQVLFRMFQFHKVRLKDRSGHTVSFQVLKFQFHKVRLKALLRSIPDHGHFVSIPQGTIKSSSRHTFRRSRCSFQFHKVRLKDNLHYSITILTMFQFHKVRLKEDCDLRPIHQTTVSIPQGTIKRLFHFARDDRITCFNSTRYD